MSFTEIFRPVFLCVLLAGTVLPLVAVLVERFCLKKISASAKHRLWTLTAVGLLLFPGVALLVRGNTERSTGKTVAESIVTETIVSKQIPMVAVTPVVETLERRPVASENIASENSGMRGAAKTQTVSRPRIDFMATATWSWLTGTVLFLLHYVVMQIRAFFVLLPLRSGKTFEEESVILSDRTTIPFAFGMLRPVIVFPAEAANWPKEKVEAVLLHEKAHITRRDLLWQNIVHFVRCVYWFHPFVWFLARRVRIEQELACDDMVLQSGRRSSDYADVLLELSKTLTAQPKIPEGGLAMVRQKTVVKRIDSILDEKTSRNPIGRKGTLGILLGVGLLTLVVSLFAPKIPFPVFAQENKTPSETPVVVETSKTETKTSEQEEELTRLLEQNKNELEKWNDRNQGKIKWTPEEQRQFLDGCIETSTKILALPVDENTKKRIEHGRMFWIRMIAFDDYEAGKKRYENVIAELEKTPGNEETIKSCRSEILSVSMNALLKKENYTERLAKMKAEIKAEFETDPDNAAKRATAMLGGVRAFCEGTLMPFDDAIEFYESGMKEYIPYFKKSDDPKIRNVADSYEGKLRFRDLVGKKLDLEGILIDGEKFDWGSYRGKPVLVYFDDPEGDTDEYCSMAYFSDAFKRVDEKYRDKGLQFVGYGMVFPGKRDYTDDALLKAMDRAKLPGVMISGNKSLAAGFQSMNEYYGCSFSPCVLLTDRDGTVLSTHIGHVHKNFADKKGEVELDRTLRSYFETGKVPERQVYVSPEKQEIINREKNKTRLESFRTELKSDVDKLETSGLNGTDFADGMATLLGKLLVHDSRIIESRRNRIQADLAAFIKERLPENLSPEQRRTIVEGTLHFAAFSLLGCPYDLIPEMLENLRWRIATVLREEKLSTADQTRLKEQLDFMRKFVAEFPMGEKNSYNSEKKKPEERLAQLDDYATDPFCPFFKKPFDKEQWEKFLKNLDRCKQSGFGSQGFRAVGILCNAVSFTVGPTKRGPGSVDLTADGPIFDFRHPGSGEYTSLYAYDNDDKARRTAGNIAKPGYWPLDPEAHKNMFKDLGRTITPISRQEAIDLAKKNDAGDFLYDGTANELVGIDGTVFAWLPCTNREESDRLSDAELEKILDEKGVGVFPLKKISMLISDEPDPPQNKFLVSRNEKRQMVVIQLLIVNPMEEAMKFREKNPNTNLLSRLAEVNGRFYPRPIPPDALPGGFYAPNGVMRKTR